MRNIKIVFVRYYSSLQRKKYSMPNAMVMQSVPCAHWGCAVNHRCITLSTKEWRLFTILTIPAILAGLNMWSKPFKVSLKATKYHLKIRASGVNVSCSHLSTPRWRLVSTSPVRPYPSFSGLQSGCPGDKSSAAAAFTAWN